MCLRLHWVAEFEEDFPSLKALCWAVEIEEKEVVQTLLEQRVDIQGGDGPGVNLSSLAEIDGNECTALQYACVKGHIRIVDALLASGAEPDACSGVYERTALQLAASLGHVEIVDLLLTARADCNRSARRGNWRTALQAASGNGNETVVEMLIARRANVDANHPKWGRTALQAASEAGHAGVVRQLLAAGGNVNARPAGLRRQAALQAAVEKGYLVVARLLLAAGAAVEDEDQIKLSSYIGRGDMVAAAYGGHLDLVGVFIGGGAVIGKGPGADQGLAAPEAAAISGRLEVVQMLLRSCADADGKGSRSRLTALAAAAKGCHLGVVESLLVAGVDADICYFDEDDEESNALCAAALGGSDAVVKRLLTAGAEGDPDLSAKSPLTEAAFHSKVSVVQVLLDAGTNINRKDGIGGTAIGYAVDADDVKTARVLLEGGANANILYMPSPKGGDFKEYPCKYKCSPLARAVHAENEEIIDLLLQHGADITIKGSEGLTPIDDAREQGYGSIELKLQKHQKHVSKGLA